MIRVKLVTLILLFSCANLNATDKVDSLKLVTYEQKAQQYLFTNKDSADKYLKLLILKSKYSGSSKGLIKGYKLIGISKHIQSEYDSSYYYYNLSKTTAIEVNDLKSVADAQSNIGLLENRRGNYKNAIQELTQACIIYDSLNLSESKGRALINIGLTYVEMGLYEKAKKTLKQSIRVFEFSGNKNDLAKCYSNIGLIHKKMNQLDSALSFYNASLDLMEQTKDLRNKASVYNNIGSIYLKKNDPSNAVNSYTKALKLKKQTGDRVGISTSLKNLTESLRLTGNYTSALQKLNEGFKEVETMGDAELLRHYYQEYALLFEAMGNYDKSLKFLKKYVTLNDSLSTMEKTKIVAEIETKYQSDKKDQEILLLEKTSEIQLAQRNIILSIALGLLIIGIFLFLFFRVSKNKNRELAAKNIIIENALSEREVLLREIHHRVKNNLQIVSSLLNVQSKLLKDPSAKIAVQTGRDRVQSMALTHKLLYQNTSLSNLSVKEYVSQLSDNLVDTYGASDEIELIRDIDEVLIDLDTAVNLGLLINELISNSMKHAFDDFENAVISILLKQKKDFIELIISDNGKGMKGSVTNKPDSYGMRLIRSLTDALKGTLSINNSIGTEVKITMPTI